MAGLLVTGATTVLTVTVGVDTAGMTITIVGAKFTETGRVTVTSSTVAVLFASAVGRVGRDCGGDHSGDHLRHTVFRESRHTR